MYLDFFFLSLLITASSLSWVFGTHLRQSDSFNLSDASIGIAVTPIFIATITYACYALTSYAFPMRVLVAVAPPASALILAGFFLLRGINAPFKWLEHRLTFFVSLAFVATLTPFLWAIHSASVIGQINHDVSLYLTQASDISLVLRDGSDGWMAWSSYSHPDVVTPHSLIFQLYMAWGFIFTDNPGFGNDYMPRLLIGLNHLALLAAFVGLSGQKNAFWGFLTAGIVTFNAIWPYEISGLSRDTFYSAPAIVVLAILLRTGPEIRPMQQPLVTGALLLALLGALNGHSLGPLLCGSLVVGAGIALFLTHGVTVFRIRALRLTAGVLSIAAVIIAIRYLTVPPAEQGFAYPFYVDPVHKLYFVNNAFSSVPSFFELIVSLLGTNGIRAVFVLLPIAAGIVLAVRAWTGRSTAGSNVWLAIVCSLITMVAIIAFLPLKLEGASLSGAFIANFRYGFPIGVLLLALLAQSGLMIFDTMRPMLERSSHIKLANAGLLGLLLITFGFAANNNVRIVQYTLSSHTNLAQIQNVLCDNLSSAGARKVLIDNNSIVYRCAANTVYIFTAAGTLITGAEIYREISAALDAQEIDAVILTGDISNLWQGTRLYSYLEVNWQQYSSEVGTIFLRPGLMMPPAD